MQKREFATYSSFKACPSFSNVGGRAGALAGAEIGGEVGGAFTIETGPFAVLGAAVGSCVFGAIGYFGMDYLLDYVDNLESELNK